MTLTGHTPAQVIMAHLTVEEFKNFFRYFKGAPSDPQQDEAIEMLYRLMPVSLLEQDKTDNWIAKYRETPPPPPAPEGIVTAQMMNDLTGHPASSFDSVFVNDCNRLFADTGFDKHLDCMQMLMANMMHETCNFVYMKEIASGVAYNNRSDLGNGPNDGPKYKGAGVLQLTGKYNYSKLAEGINDPKVMDGVDYVADTYPFTSARVWIEENQLLNVCLNKGFEACCVKINGGYNGFDDRCAKYEICKRVMK